MMCVYILQSHFYLRIMCYNAWGVVDFNHSLSLH